jgi:hypothetical protein
MNIREIIALRDKVKNDLAVIEKFLVIARKQGLLDESGLESEKPAVSTRQETLKAIVAETNGEYGTIGKSVLEAIKLCPGEFTVNDIDEAVRRDLKREFTRVQISTVLARLLKQTKIAVVKEKRGRNPAIYKRT